MLENLSSNFMASLGKLTGGGSNTDMVLKEIRSSLLEADVALPVVKDFMVSIRERIATEENTLGLNEQEFIVSLVHRELVTTLGESTAELTFEEDEEGNARAKVIMLVGLQGAGKTTFAAKLAKHLKEQGHNPLLIAADLFRPNATEQLRVQGSKIDVPVWGKDEAETADVLEVVSKGMAKAAEDDSVDLVIIDTAGRLPGDDSAIEQANGIKELASPGYTIFVADGMMGQNSAVTAQTFLDRVGFDGVVLTKMDGDSRGGAVLSVYSTVKRPIFFLSNGEGVGELEVFHPDRVAGRILDMGDVLTLVEKAEKEWNLTEAQKEADKIRSGDFNLNDFQKQLDQLSKLGGITKVMKLIPGAGALREAMEQVTDRDIARQKSIILSMTLQEKLAPGMVTGSRLTRVAKGSGTTEEEVTALIERFFQARDMMKNLGAADSIKMLSGNKNKGPRKPRF